MRRALDVLAERIAMIIEFERAADDVADHQRGHYFPPHLITRDARKGAPQSFKEVIPFEDLPDRLLHLAKSADLLDIDVGIILTAMSVNLQQRFEHFFIVLNNEVDTAGRTSQLQFALLDMTRTAPRREVACALIGRC